MSTKRNLKIIAAEVLNGRPEAAFMLPTHLLVRVHIYVTRIIRDMSEQQFNRVKMNRLYEYFKGLDRYQRGVMWKIFTKLAMEQATRWYKIDDGKKVEPYVEIICNCLFCKQELHKGRWVRVKDTPAEYYAKCRSLHAVCYGELEGKEFIPGRSPIPPKDIK
jgi:hypothetical protein